MGNAYGGSALTDAVLAPMDAPFINRILALAPSAYRPPILGNPDGSKRQWIFNDADGKYEELAYVPTEHIQVSSLGSFRELVGNRLTPGDGSGATVIFTQKGALFVRSKDSLDSYSYVRRLHPTWEAVTGAVGKTFDHAGFLRFLHAISTVVKDYPAVIRAFKRVVFNKNAQVSSAPLLDDDGGAHLSYSLEMTARDGKSQARLPGVLELAVPYTPEQTLDFPITLELDIVLVGDALRFTIFAPELPGVALDALRTETNEFGLVQKEHPNLLVLEDL